MSANPMLPVRTQQEPARNLTSVTPAASPQTQGAGRGKRARAKPAADGEGKLDRVDRQEAGGGIALELVTREEDGRRRGLHPALDHDEPELEQPLGHSGGFRFVEGRAFRRDAQGRPVPPSPADVEQGNLGDAWLLASFAAVARARPGALLERVVEKGPGLFQVRLGQETLEVSSAFSSEGYAEPRPNGQADTLWCALLEKAFALWEAGSYQRLEQGSPGRALELLTGLRSRRISLHSHRPPEGVWAALVEAKRAGAPMVARTREAQVELPLVADHAYAVVDVVEVGQVRSVSLYNPWGTARGERSVESMIATVPLTTLVRDAETLHLSRADAPLR